MTIGYIFEVVLAAVLISAYFVTNRWARVELFLCRLLLCFYDCVTFFTFSIQIASIVVLVKVDSGISGALMGDTTVRLTWIVSTLSLLPMMQTLMTIDYRNRRAMEPGAESRSKQRFVHFIICWALSIYPFFSRMVETFQPSVVGNQTGAVISDGGWTTIEQMCLAGTNPPSEIQYTLMTSFGITGSLVLSLFAGWNILLAGIQKHYPDRAASLRIMRRISPRFRNPIVVVLLQVLSLISAFLIWSYLRLQKFQSQVSAGAGAQDSVKQWAFGQIVAAVVLLPVLGEALFLLCQPKKVDPSGESETPPSETLLVKEEIKCKPRHVIAV